LRQVILVQLILMVALLIAVAFPFMMEFLAKPKVTAAARSFRPGRLIRSVSENEVIAEFLKSDFYSPAFQEYQESFRDLVRTPDLDDAKDNAKRRALLFIRHLALWKEIPTGTIWYEMDIDEEDLGQIRAFPRAQWRKLARGNFSVTGIVHTMHTRQRRGDAQFLSKIASIGDQLLEEAPGFGPVILIGLNDNGPLTVLDGNHRLVAALLASPGSLKKLRFLCGLSPRMTECCWYNTNPRTLFRYGKNMLARALRNPKAELAYLLRHSDDRNALAEVMD